MGRESLVLLPRPRRLIRSGEGFRLPPDTRIAFRGPDQDLVPIAAEIKRDLLELQGLRARVEAGGPGGDEAAIELLLGDDEDLPAEGYTLDIRARGRATARVRRARRLLPGHDPSAGSAPGGRNPARCTNPRSPRPSLPGAMLDVSRDMLGEELSTIIGEHERLWLAGNRVGGLRDGIRSLERCLREYRQEAP
jgi:hypothetical protein